MHNSVFAFNADAPQSATPLWQVNLGPTVPSGLYNFTDILPEIGILGTPAIDAAQQVMYVVADTLPAGAFSNPVFQLHALSLVDGHEMFGGPVQIAASVSGTGAGSSNGTIAFDASQQLQRPGLMLANGNCTSAFGSHADAGNYQGWMLAYNPSTLQLTAVFNSAPNGRQAAFWHSGRAPAVDGNGDVYCRHREWRLGRRSQFRRIAASSFGRQSFVARLVHAAGMEQPERSGLGSGIGWRNIDSGHQLSAHGR